jgi:DNA-binding transcriptional ArsR family regulator
MGKPRQGQGRGKRKVSGRKGKRSRRGDGAKKGGSPKKARERSARAINPKLGVLANDPLRADIVTTALQRLYSPSEYARDANIKLGTASYHFKVLKEKGLLELVELVQVRGATKHMYRANKAAFIDDREWGELAQVLRPGVIGATLDNFAARFAQAGETGTLFEREDVCAYWAPRDFDELAWEEHVKVTRWWIEESERLEQETVQRKAEGKSSKSFKATVAIFAFPSPTDSEVKSHRRKRQTKTGKSSAAKSKKRKPAKSKSVKRKPKEKGGKA